MMQLRRVKWLLFLLVGLLLIPLQSGQAASKRVKTLQAPLAGKIEAYPYRGNTYHIPAVYLQYQHRQLALLTVSHDHKGHVMVVSYIGAGKETPKTYRFNGQLRYFASLYSKKAFMAAYLKSRAQKQDYLTNIITAATQTQPVVNPQKKSVQFSTVPVLYQFDGMNKTTGHPVRKQNLTRYQQTKQLAVTTSKLNAPQVAMINQSGQRASLPYQTADTRQLTVDPLGIFQLAN